MLDKYSNDSPDYISGDSETKGAVDEERAGEWASADRADMNVESNLYGISKPKIVRIRATIDQS